MSRNGYWCALSLLPHSPNGPKHCFPPTALTTHMLKDAQDSVWFSYLIYSLIPMAINCRGWVTVFPQLQQSPPAWTNPCGSFPSTLSSQEVLRNTICFLKDERKPLLYITTTHKTTNFILEGQTPLNPI